MSLAAQNDSVLEEKKQRRIFWSLCFLGWCALVTSMAGIMAAFKVFPFGFALQFALGFWASYALAAPCVIWFARRFPVNRNNWRTRIWLHAVGSVLFVAVCESGFAVFFHFLEPRIREYQTGWPGQENEAPASIRPIPMPRPLINKVEPSFPKPSLRLAVFKSQFGIPIYWVLVGVTHSLAAMSALRTRDKQAAQLEAQLTHAQLASLRTQLQPHFLFNTLNSIAALIPKNAKLATEMVMNLSDLLRMTLREPQRNEIRLHEELTLLQHYVDIQRLRFGDRLSFHIVSADEAKHALVPPLLLQPLVENAIRHGVEASDQTEQITVRASILNQDLQVEVANTFMAGAEETPHPPDSTGVGLANTQARLKVQYGNRHYMKAGPLPGGGFEVTIKIPCSADTEEQHKGDACE